MSIPPFFDAIIVTCLRQDKTGLNRTVQVMLGKAGQVRSGLDRTRHNKTEQDWTGQNSTGKNAILMLLQNKN